MGYIYTHIPGRQHCLATWCSNDTEIQVAQQPHSCEESLLTKCGEQNLTGVGPEVGLQVGRLGVDLLAA